MFFGKYHFKGSTESTSLFDLDRREIIMLLPLALITIAFGIFPQLLLNFINPFAQGFNETILQTGKALQALIQP